MSFTSCNILGVRINNVNLNEATAISLLYIDDKETDKKIIFTPNPEFIINAIKDKEFMKILNESNLNIPDGIGVVIAGKILGYHLKERVAGYDLVQNIFYKIKHRKKTVYFLGSSKENIEKAKAEMEKKYRGLSIVGASDGYFSKETENEVIQDINDKNPDILLVGLGSPKQEKWIFENKDKLNAKLFIAIGGSFDVMCGKTKRAPKLFIKLNLEWFYRLITQPTRAKRMLVLPLFIIKVVLYKIGGKYEK